MNKKNVATEWQKTSEAQTVLQQFYNVKSRGRGLFGILENPAEHTSIEEVRYKLVLMGKSGVGKTWTVARLAGIAGSYASTCHSSETVGVRVTDVYWPVKIWDRIILFKLTVWDPGSHSFKKYSYIPETCQDKADMQILLFSYSDASSLADLLPLIDKCVKKQEENLPGLVIIGTRYLPKTEVTKLAVQDFQLKHNVHIMSLPAVTAGSSEIAKVSPILNLICEQLWFRDQQYIKNQKHISQDP